MKTSKLLIHSSLSIFLALLIGCAASPSANTTSKRTIAEVQAKIKTDMPLEELWDYINCMPIMTEGYDRFMLVDGDLWIVEGRNEKGWDVVNDWRFEKR